VEMLTKQRRRMEEEIARVPGTAIEENSKFN
jgi:hypothetical protein